MGDGFNALVSQDRVGPWTLPNFGSTGPTLTFLAAQTSLRPKHLCGEGGIRTRGTFRYTRFPVVHLRPLGHLSLNDKEHEGRVRCVSILVGGERGIRTHGTRKGTLDFESSAFDRSASSPRAKLAKRPSQSNTDFDFVFRGMPFGERDL